MSKKHPGAGRVRRERHDEDVFVESVLESGVWARNHGRTLLYAGIAAFIVIAIAIYYRNFTETTKAKAETELGAVRATVVSGNKQLAATDLEKFVAKFGKTPAGEEARTMLAQTYLSLNQPQKAVTAIQPIANDIDEGAAPAFLLGGAYEALKQSDQAEQTYLRIADKARFGFEKREALERAAGIRLEKGNTAGAIELYNKALETLEDDSPERTIYEMRIAELRGAAPTKS